MILESEDRATQREIAQLKQEANAGSAKAALKLGRISVEGPGPARNPVEAERWFRRAMELGESRARSRLGVLLLRTASGETEAERKAEGLRLLRESTAEEALPNLMLGRFHATGTHLAKDYEAAERHFRRAAELGDPAGWFRLGWLNSGAVGFDERIRPREALSVLERAFRAGHMEAGRLLAKLLREGERVPRDEKRAFEIVAEAAERGSAPARFFLGQLYEEGMGVDPDPQKAVEAFRQAAEAGHAKAQNEIGMLLASGGGGVKADPDAALEWLRKAAAQKHAPAHFNLALLLDARAAESGNVPSQEAVRHLVIAANGGLPGAQNRLGAWYRDGHHVVQDVVAAMAWFKPAAEAGLVDAKINFARLLELTTSRPDSLQAAFASYREAADAGHPVGHFHLGRMMLSGVLGKSDAVRGYAHLLTAADSGVSQASEALLSARSGLTSAEVEQARSLRAEFESLRWIDATETEAAQK